MLCGKPCLYCADASGTFLSSDFYQRLYSGMYFLPVCRRMRIMFLGYKLITRILPGAYFSVKVLFSGIKAKLARLALK